MQCVKSLMSTSLVLLAGLAVQARAQGNPHIGLPDKVEYRQDDMALAFESSQSHKADKDKGHAPASKAAGSDKPESKATAPRKYGKSGKSGNRATAQPQQDRQPQQARKSGKRKSSTGASREARNWQKGKGWQKGESWKGSPNWKGSRARNWNDEHRTWAQRGGYGGYRIPPGHYGRYYGPEKYFKLKRRPVIYQGYPRFYYGGYNFLIVDPWPEYWADNWYNNDDVYIVYDDGYYLYNRSQPSAGVSITVNF